LQFFVSFVLFVVMEKWRIPHPQSRVLTLVFTDLADSTALKTQYDDVARAVPEADSCTDRRVAVD
jgi:hypothetical protein